MQDITVQREALIKVIEENKYLHRQLFLEAWEGYEKAVILHFETQLAAAKAGKAVSWVALPMPQDHTVDYERVIRMLELSVDNTIKLDEADVAMYVQDDWAWKRQFIGTASTYTATANG